MKVNRSHHCHYSLVVLCNFDIYAMIYLNIFSFSFLKFQSQECLEKVAKTISFLTRPGQAYLLLLTGTY